MKAAKRDKATTILRVAGGLSIASVALAAGFALYITLSLGPTLPDVEPLASDTLVGPRGQPVVPFAAIPPVVSRAFLVADDPSYLEHRGLHTGTIVRMFATRLYDPSAGPRRETALVEQLAKVLLAAHDQHPWPRFSGALREVMLTVQLENGLDRDQLLGAYLNNIPFGLGVRGVVAASKEYFRKPLAELTVSEAATLAAMPHLPASLVTGPPGGSREHRVQILDGLLAAGVITAAQHDVATRDDTAQAKQAAPGR